MADLSMSFDPNKISAASDSASDAISKATAYSDAASKATSDALSKANVALSNASDALSATNAYLDQSVKQADGPSFGHIHLADLTAIYTPAESWIGPSSTAGIYFKGGNVGIGTTNPAASALLDLTSVTGALLLSRMTTVQQAALTAVNGMILYDATLNKFHGYENGSWVDLKTAPVPTPAFLDLPDVNEASYATHGGMYVRVDAGETGLEFVNLAGGGTVLGAGANTQIAYWTAADTIDGDADFLWDGNRLFVNETSDAKVTQGVVIQQSGNDDFIMSFKSTDIAHGMTARAETDTYGALSKALSADGGLRISGWIGGSTYTEGIVFSAYSAVCDAVKSTAGGGMLELVAAKISGADITDVDANTNIFSLRCRKGGAWTTSFLVDEDGDTYPFGALCLPELATQTNESGWGKLYTKSDNFPYFLSDAGDEFGLLESTFLDNFADASVHWSWTQHAGNGTITESGSVMTFAFAQDSNCRFWNGVNNAVSLMVGLPAYPCEIITKINSCTFNNGVIAGLLVGFGLNQTNPYGYKFGHCKAAGGASEGIILHKLTGSGSSIAYDIVAEATLPIWLKCRINAGNAYGNTLTFWYSTDGSAWTQYVSVGTAFTSSTDYFLAAYGDMLAGIEANNATDPDDSSASIPFEFFKIIRSLGPG